MVKAVRNLRLNYILLCLVFKLKDDIPKEINKILRTKDLSEKVKRKPK